MKTVSTWILSLTILILAGHPTVLPAADWPQYRGPNNDGISKETGLIKEWPAAGPKVVWKVPTGDGYSAVSVSNGKLYTMAMNNKDEFVISLDASTGKELWRVRIDSGFVNDQGDGPRGTPLVQDGIVYALGAQSQFVALDAASGKTVWQKDLKKELSARVPRWGVSSSPLPEGDMLIFPVGGGDGNAVVALQKKTGAVVWKSQTDEPGYSSAIAVTIGGLRQIVAFSGTMLLSLNPADGKLFWKYPWKTDYFVNSAMPVFIAPDKIFISTSYDKGAALLQVKVGGGKAAVSEVWLTKGMKNHFNTSVYYDGHLYGFDNAVLKCMDAATSETKWQKSGFGKGSLILADGQLIVLGERGQLALVDATPDAYTERAMHQALQGKCWTQPTLANGRLYLRNQKEILCIDMKKS